MKIYLCGPINGCSDDQALSWRQIFEQYKEFEYVNPMKRDYRGKEAGNHKEIVDLDKRDIKNCDAVVCMFVQPSVGTSMEVFYAYTLGIPVVTIDKSNKPLSPWLIEHSTSVVKTIEEALDKLKFWLL